MIAKRRSRHQHHRLHRRLRRKDKVYSFRVVHTCLTPCRLSGGAIAGIVICVVLSISLILLGVFIWRRRERSQASSSKTSRRRTIDIETLQTKHSFGTGPVIHHTPSLPALPPLRIPSPSNSIMISVSPIESDSDAEGDNKPLTPLNVDSGAMVLVPHGNSSDGHHGVGVVSESDAGPSAEFLSGVREGETSAWHGITDVASAQDACV